MHAVFCRCVQTAVAATLPACLTMLTRSISQGRPAGHSTPFCSSSAMCAPPCCAHRPSAHLTSCALKAGICRPAPPTAASSAAIILFDWLRSVGQASAGPLHLLQLPSAHLTTCAVGAGVCRLAAPAAAGPAAAARPAAWAGPRQLQAQLRQNLPWLPPQPHSHSPGAQGMARHLVPSQDAVAGHDEECQPSCQEVRALNRECPMNADHECRPGLLRV